MRRLLPWLVLAGCDPYHAWPAQHEVFPWVTTPEEGLEDWEHVRWEEGPWDPEVDVEKNGQYVQKALLHRIGAPVEVQYHWGLMRPSIPPYVPEHLVLSLVGDVMDTGDPPTDFSQVADRLDGTLRMGNLETPVAPGVTVGPGAVGVPDFNAPESLLDGLPLDIVQLNNNHSLDAGDSGLFETLEALQEREIWPVGVDGQLLIDFGDGLLVGVLAYTWGVNDPDAVTAYDLNIVPFGASGPVDLSRVSDDITAVEDAGASLVVVMVHWGYEYEYHPDPHLLKLGRKLVKRGADLVVGHGPHVVQPAEICAVNVPAVEPRVGTCSVRTDDGVPRYAGVLYSLGNFGTHQPTVPVQVGIISTVSLLPGYGVTGMSWEAVASTTGPEGQVLVPLEDLLDDPAYAEEAARLDQHLGTGTKRLR